LSDSSTRPGPAQAPARQLDRSALRARTVFDFRRYGFELRGALANTFDIIPVRADDDEVFLFFYVLADLAAGRFGLFNLHGFVKRRDPLDDFAHSLGPSVATVPLEDTRFGQKAARTYVRRIAMKELFSGAPQVIEFIGGHPDLNVRDSHTYFLHNEIRYYTGMLHSSEDSGAYDALRAELERGIVWV
jgi:hypothetical protein